MASLYWRLYITATNNGLFNVRCTIAELEMRATVGGADQCNGGTASASRQSGSYPASQAFDNDDNTFWEAIELDETFVWLQYEFTSPVDVREISIKAVSNRGSWAPKDFDLQYSDNGTDWNTVQSFTGEIFTDGEQREFAIPGPIVDGTVNQPYSIGLFIPNTISTPYGIEVASTVNQPYEGSVKLTVSQPYGIEVANTVDQPYPMTSTIVNTVDFVYGMPLYATGTQIYGIEIASTSTQDFGASVSNTVSTPVHYTIAGSNNQVYFLLHVLNGSNEQKYNPTNTVISTNSQTSDILEYNKAIGTYNQFYSLDDPSIIVTSNDVTLNGRYDLVASASVSISDNDNYWKGSIGILNGTFFDSLSVGDSISLKLGSDTYSFVVNQKTRSRSFGNADSMDVSVVSSSYAKEDVVKDWTFGTSLAKNIVESALGESVEWNIVDWTIESSKLSFINSSSINLANNIVSSVGGVLQSKYDGTMKARYAFPIPVNEWESSVPDHTVSDNENMISTSESYIKYSGRNRFFITDDNSSTNDSGFLSLENVSENNVAGGTATIRMFHDESIEIDNINLSAGSIYKSVDGYSEITEQLQFIGSNIVELSKPLSSIISYEWIGNDLGDVEVSYGSTIKSASSGYSILEIKYKSISRDYILSSPETIAGRDSFSIIVEAEGVKSQQVGSNNLIVYRGDGDLQGEDIVDEFLMGDISKLARGRNELDSNELFKSVDISILYRDGLEAGQLIRIDDNENNTRMFGKIRSINHNVDPLKTVTNINVMVKM